jgi:large subunit ribosomal protein L15
VRLLARGALKSKITITVAGASKKAVEAVETAGGSITVTVARSGAVAADKAGAGSEAAAKSGAAKPDGGESDGA